MHVDAAVAIAVICLGLARGLVKTKIAWGVKRGVTIPLSLSNLQTTDS